MKKIPRDIVQYFPLRNIQKGCYQLDLRLDRPVRLQVGSLGRLDLAKGHYIYTGRHKKALNARIRRHLQAEKTVYWHIDYFTTHAAIEIVKVIVYPEIDSECQINQDFHRFFNSNMVYPGLGSGDCIHSCISHVQYLTDLSGKLLSRWIEKNFSVNPILLELTKFKGRNIYA